MARNSILPVALGSATALAVVLMAGGCGGQTVPNCEFSVPSRFGALGNHALAQGSHSRAIEYFDQAVLGYTEEMSRSGARMDLALDMANCIERRGDAHLFLGDLNEAFTDYNTAAEGYRALLQLAECADARPGRARCLLSRGTVLMSLMMYGDAYRDFDLSAGAYQELANGRGGDAFRFGLIRSVISRGCALRSALQLHKAKQDFVAAIRLCERTASVRASLCGVCLRLLAYANLTAVEAMDGEPLLAIRDSLIGVHSAGRELIHCCLAASVDTSRQLRRLFGARSTKRTLSVSPRG
jgi:tetratricopeptide (TPR) repeat protein